MPNNSQQKAKFWIATVPGSSEWTPPSSLPPKVIYMCGQKEIGSESGYIHWQVMVTFSQQVRRPYCLSVFTNNTHVEPTRSEAAEAYCTKEDTAVPGSRFVLGARPLKRNSKTDWEKIKLQAKTGNIEEVPADIFIRHYSTLNRIAKDYAQPTFRGEQEVYFFWGVSGSGKSHRVFDEIGEQKYYLKAPTTKWFDGYQGENIIVIDEFRGVVEISHLLKWLDKYPCAVEVKGGQAILKSKKWYITSNLPYTDWYKDLDEETMGALARRLKTIVHFDQVHQ